MTRKMIIPLLFGLIGCAVLIALGTWQVRRLAEKEALLADINARISAAPVALPAVPDRDRDAYLPVMIEGELTGESVLVLASIKLRGAIYRVISVLDTGDQRLLVDRGYRKVAGAVAFSETGPVALVGNLHWPVETDSFTPAPEDKAGRRLYFARDVADLAEYLNTDPVLVVAREVTPTDPELTPLPVTGTGIPNDHLQYAITWFLLTIVWAGMTAFLLWRIRARTD